MTASRDTFNRMRVLNRLGVAGVFVFLASFAAGDSDGLDRVGLLGQAGLAVFLACHLLFWVVAAVGIRCPHCGGRVTAQTTRSGMDGGPNPRCDHCGHEVATM